MDAALAQTPPISVLKVFLVSYSPNPSCVPNLKLLASTVAKISKGFHNVLDAALAQAPPILVLTVVFR